MPSLILLRGLPGSGKSTLAKELSESGKYPIHSIDDYFTDPVTGEYVFQFDKNHLAYKQCETETENSLMKGYDKVFVHNTFTLEWETEPYCAMAKKYGYLVFFITVENRHGGKNIHGITKEQIEKMGVGYKVVLL